MYSYDDDETTILILLSNAYHLICFKVEFPEKSKLYFFADPFHSRRISTEYYYLFGPSLYRDELTINRHVGLLAVHLFPLSTIDGGALFDDIRQRLILELEPC
jgi:hypothetical protein